MPDDNRPVTKYPEHEKLHALQGESQKLGEFLTWLEQGVTLCKERRRRHDPELVPWGMTIEKILGAYFGVDPDKLGREKDAMFGAMRASQVAQ